MKPWKVRTLVYYNSYGNRNKMKKTAICLLMFSCASQMKEQICWGFLCVWFFSHLKKFTCCVLVIGRLMKESKVLIFFLLQDCFWSTWAGMRFLYKISPLIKTVHCSLLVNIPNFSFLVKYSEIVKLYPYLIVWGNVFISPADFKRNLVKSQIPQCA